MARWRSSWPDVPSTSPSEFLDDIAEHGLMAHVTKLHKALLILHSRPTIRRIDKHKNFVAARHPKSFVSLSGADHLLSQRRDYSYVADVIAAWAERYIETVTAEPRDLGEAPRMVVVRETRAASSADRHYRAAQDAGGRPVAAAARTLARAVRFSC